MRTKAFNEAMPAAQQLAETKKAKGGTWYDGWRPYCMILKCSSPRMLAMPYGFWCPDCGNMIGHDLTRLEESPLPKDAKVFKASIITK